jgi:hypothetical protein
MWEKVFEAAINYGLMSMLFVALFVWVLRNSRDREQRYQSMIDKLHDALNVVAEIQRITKEISDTLAGLTKDLKGGKRNVKIIKKSVE